MVPYNTVSNYAGSDGSSSMTGVTFIWSDPFIGGSSHRCSDVHLEGWRGLESNTVGRGRDVSAVATPPYLHCDLGYPNLDNEAWTLEVIWVGPRTRRNPER